MLSHFLTRPGRCRQYHCTAPRTPQSRQPWFESPIGEYRWRVTEARRRPPCRWEGGTRWCYSNIGRLRECPVWDGIELAPYTVTIEEVDGSRLFGYVILSYYSPDEPRRSQRHLRLYREILQNGLSASYATMRDITIREEI